MMLGEDEEEILPDEAESAYRGAQALSGTITVGDREYACSEQFAAKPAWQRFIIVAAGPVFNFFLAFLLAFVITSVYGSDRSIAIAVDEGFPLAAAGMEAGDTITGFGRGTNAHISGIATAREIELYLYEHSDILDGESTVAVRFRDASEGGITKTVYVQSLYDEGTGSYRLGFSYSEAYIETENLAETLYYSFREVVYCIKSALASVRLLVSGRVGREDVLGPVGMVAVMDETFDSAADYSYTLALMSLFELMALISGSLGAMNLLPVPALDGGRLIFIFMEMITHRPVPRRIEGMVHTAGFVLLFALMIFIMFNDAVRLVFG